MLPKPPPPRPFALKKPEPPASNAAPEVAPKVDERLVPAPGVVIVGKYELTRLLKKGGMASVWVANHLGLDSPVAIKFMMLRPPKQQPADPDGGEEGDDQLRARFEREAKAAAQIRATNVVQIFDYGIDRGTPYLVMELLTGEDLAARLDREKRIGLPETSRILNQVARALERAHAAGLVHRDLKPENIFICKEGNDDVVKILDFGVAKALHGNQAIGTPTLDGHVIGTPHYMSPEQATGATDIDRRSDLWSLGVVLFRMVTGRLPFESTLLLEAIVKICSAPIPTATSMAGDLGHSVDGFFERALSRDPELRFQSAKELAAAFEDLLVVQGLPRPAPLPPTGLYEAVAPPASAPSAGRGWAGPVALGVVIAIGAFVAYRVSGKPEPTALAETPPASTGTVAAQEVAPPAPSVVEAPTATTTVATTTTASSQAAPAVPRKLVPKGTATATSTGTVKKRRDLGY